MMRALRRLIVLALLGVVVVATAATAVSSPGLLRPEDLPRDLHQVGNVQTFPNLDSEVVDAGSCALSTQPFDRALGVFEIDFGPGRTPAETVLTERVVSFASETTARRAFAREVASHGRGLRCGMVNLPSSDGTAPQLRFAVEKQKFPAVGHRSFAERTLAANGVPATVSVTFVSGRHLVILAVRDLDGAPTTPEALGPIAKRAEKRLRTAATV
jgi:hypothetical protein